MLHPRSSRDAALTTNRRQLEQIPVRHLLLLLRIYDLRSRIDHRLINWVAVPFTPAANYTAKKIQVSVGFVTGLNGVTVSLNADSGGLPGAATGERRLTGPVRAMASAAPGGCAGGGGLPVNPGHTVLGGSEHRQHHNTTFDAWAFNSTDMRRPIRSRRIAQAAGVWAASEGLLPGYAVYGQ